MFTPTAHHGKQRSPDFRHSASELPMLTFGKKGSTISHQKASERSSVRWRLHPSDRISHGEACMTIKEKMHGDVAVLTFKGNLMGEPDTTEVREKIYGLLQEGFAKIVLDMGQVKWVNSSGLGTMIAAMTSVKNKGGELRLARVTDKVESLFAITQLIKVFKTYETVERAVASFK
jgi:anti-sigma B factor antagonist